MKNALTWWTFSLNISTMDKIKLREKLDRIFNYEVRQFIKTGYAATGGTASWHHRTTTLVKGERKLEIEGEINCSLPHIEIRKNNKIVCVKYI